MKTFSARRHNGIADVKIVDEGRVRELPLRLDLYNHSPTGFEWGYAGSGPAQLAIALLAEVLQDDKTAIALHQIFKFKVIGRLERDSPWQLTERDVLQYAAEVSELPLMRMPNGSIRRACLDCVMHLQEQGIIVADPLGVFDCAPGVTLDDARKAVAGRHGHHEGHP
jgi:hypothetical protein